MSNFNNPNPEIPGLLSRPRSAGLWYGQPGGSVAATAVALTADRIALVPFLVITTETFDRIGITVTVGAVGKARLGIYQNVNGLPGALVLDAGEVDTAVAEDKEIVINQTLSPGLYWLAITSNATPTVRLNSDGFDFVGIGSTLTTGGHARRYNHSAAYGALPDPFPALNSTSSDTGPAICLRRA